MPVRGFPQAQQNLRRLRFSILEAMEEQSEENAEELLSDASDLAPQDEGDLIDSGLVTDIDTRSGGDGRFIRIVSFDTPYAVRWHEDTFTPGEVTRGKPGAGRKYLSRAFNKKQKRFQKRIQTSVFRRIQIEQRRFVRPV